MNFTDPPPNNAGARKYTGPRRKTLEFEKFKFTYDYGMDFLTVEEILDCQDSENKPRAITFAQAELEEFRSALRSFGLEAPPGPGVYCR